jgi:hypothetical protein
MAEEAELWNRLVLIHNHVKELLLCAEELDLHFWTFPQPLLELRSALEHIIRCQASKAGIRPPDAGYEQANLDKALGHEYRAFFDVADWISISLRERIADALGPFPNEAIAAVIPDYYRTIRPGIERLNIEIARIRSAKDIAGDDILRQTTEYDAKIRELTEFNRTLAAHVPSLLEWHAKDRRGKVRERLFDLAKLAIGAVLGFLLGWLAKSWK